MKNKQKPLYLLMVLALLAGLLGFQPAQPVQAASQALRISQAYGGGGNSGATYTNDFIEIFNSSNTAIDLEGWSVQYAASLGIDWQVTPLTGTIPANGYYLIQEATNGGGTTSLPTPDATGSIAMSQSQFKVALVNTTTQLTGECPNGGNSVIDFLGNGIANCYEGTAAAPAITKITSAQRADGGCTDTDQNSTDFIVGDPIPRNSAFPTNICSLGDQPPTVASTVPANGADTVAVNANITITFSEPVTVEAGWYSISCGTSNTYTAAVDPANPIFTLNPDADFTLGETCTVTIDHTKVSDNDETVDYMAADHSFTFTITNGCVGAYTPIYNIQGSGPESPFVGEIVTTQGVVVGDFQTEEIEKEGFFIQDINGDSDSATSDGIFIYYPGGLDVNEGDEVRLTGSVSEYYGATQITGSSLQICSTGNPIVPTPVSLPVTAVDDFEKVEGMLVTFTQPLVISEYFNFDRYGEIVLTSERHMTPTAVEEPGTPEQAAAAQDYLLDRITLDDGRISQNPDPAIHPNGLEFTMDNLFRGGGTVAGVTGVMDYSFDLYRVQLTEGGTYVDANPRPTAPDIIEADLKVTSFNVLNYFVTLDDGTNDICGPSGTMECRGADTAEEFTRQKAKILAAMVAIDSDIYGLMEIENDSPVSGNNAVADLVDGLNAAIGVGTYAYIQTGAIGTDAIKQAILYKPASVTPVGTYQILDSTVDPDFIDTKNRPVIAQVFEDNDTGEQFVVAVNHLKSKGSCPEPGDDYYDEMKDIGDGQSCWSPIRLAAAEALVDWLADTTKFPDVEKKLIIGDLNSYDKEDPIDAIKLGADDTADTEDDYLDMIFELRGDDAYGYVFDGQTGYLDHALANLAMVENVVDVNFWHINADEPDMIDYDMSFKADAQDDLYEPDAYRSSDHDPVIVTLKFNKAPVAVEDAYTTNEDEPLTVSAIDGVLANDTDADGDSLTAVLVDDVSNGTLAMTDDGSFVYTPVENFFGTASFTYKAFDGVDYSDIVTVTITVNEVAPEDFTLYLPLIMK